MRKGVPAVSAVVFSPTPLDPDFPVTRPHYGTRGSEITHSPHAHDAFELGYCYEGAGFFIIDQKICSFKSGDAAVIGNSEFHLSRAAPGQTTRWGFLYLDLFKLLSENIGAYSDVLKAERFCGAEFRNIIDSEEHPEITSVIREIFIEMSEGKPGYRPMVKALVWQLLLRLERYFTPSEVPELPGDNQAIRRIAPALDFLACHYTEPLEISELARLCFSSESNFRKLFNRAVGCAAMPYVMKLRLEAAAAMLRNTREAVSEVALLCGFRTLAHFNRSFRKHYGVSPLTWRRLKETNPADEAIPAACV